MYKVVLVDDEIWGLRGMKKIFPWETYGFEVVGEFTESTEAFEEIVKIYPDVVFTDIKMAGMSGIDLINKLRNKIKAEYVIVSAYRDFDYAKKAIEFEVTEYCVKPVSCEEAIKILEKLKRKLDKNKGLNDYSEYIGSLEFDFSSIKNEKFKQMVMYIIANYNIKLRLNRIAEMFDLNESYCTSLFIKHFGFGFSGFVNLVRIKKAAEIFKTTDMSIENVALSCGYDDYFYFSKVFKKQMGITPKAFCVKYRSKNQ